MAIDLRAFVANTLTEIMEGVAGAQTEAARVGAGAMVSPQLTGSNVQAVEFDLEVTAVDGSDAKARVGVPGGWVGLGAEGASREESRAASRVRFSVWVQWPQHHSTMKAARG